MKEQRLSLPNIGFANAVKFLSFSIFLFACLMGLAQETPSQIERFSIEQGLSNSSLYCLIQDRQGFIWVGTQGGLNRYDGYGFVSYDRDPNDATSLNDNFINCLLEDRAGMIWAGTREGASRFDKGTGKFTNFLFDPTDPEHTLFNHIIAFEEDKEGNIWMATKGGLAILEFGQKMPRRAPLNFENDKIANLLPIHTLMVDENDQLWGGAETGLFRLDSKSGKAKNILVFDDQTLPAVQSICNDGQYIWAGTVAGVYQINKVTGQSKLFKSETAVLNEVATITKDSRGRILVGNVQGIDILDPQTGLYSPFFSYRKSNDWFRPSRPQAILEDREHTFWIASLWDALYHFDPMPKRIQHFYQKPSPINPNPDLNVVGIYEDSHGQVWVGSGMDLSLVDPETGQFSIKFLQPDALFKAIFEDREGTIWAGTRFGVIKQELGKTAQWLRYDRNDSNHLSPGGTKFILEDHLGILWFGGGDGLFRHELGSSVFMPFSIVRTSLDTNVIYHLAEDASFNIWVSTNNGLIRIDSQRQDVRYFLHDPKDRNSICDNNISCVSVAQNGQMWVASYDGGLDKFNAETESFTHFGRKEGLLNDKIWGMVEDDGGYLWLSTSLGLTRFDPETNSFLNFDRSDGIQEYEFSMVSFDKGQKSRKIYFGGVNGFNVFHPDSLFSNQKPPPVVFTAFRYHEGGQEESDLKNIPGISVLNEVILPYQATAIVCEFAALDYHLSSKKRYAYRLEGARQNWIDLGSKREVTFANLRPGKYTLHVKASANDGVWNEEGARLRLVVLPPWWATWWAYLLYAGSLGAGIWFFYRYQLRRRLEQQEALRLRELDEFKNRFFTNITHEFRTPLTVILGASDQLAVGSEQWAVSSERAAVRGKLNLVKRNGENLLRLINQLLDLAKVESNSLKINYVQGDVLPYLRYVLESLQSLANAQNILLRMESDQATLIMDYDPDRLLQIVYNLLSNAIKFTPTGGKVTLSSGVERGNFKENYFSLTVSDQGVGIPPEDLPHIFDRFYQANNLKKAKTGGTGIGLSLTKELVETMGGSISVGSEVGKGTTFRVKLPLTNLAALSDKVADNKTEFDVFQPSKVATTEADQPTVLIVEDNPDVVEYLASCLEKNYLLDFAFNGQAGIEKALETIPDLIVSDVMMPEKDGFELCDFLKNDERTSHIPVVLLTAKADVQSRLSGLRRGADAYLAKPFHEEELLVTLSNLLELRRKLQAKYAAISELGFGMSDRVTSEIRNPKSEIEDVFLQKVHAAVLGRLSDPKLSVDELSQDLAMSQSQLLRKLKALTGKNTTLFIRSIRLARAKELLQGKKLNVSEVAYEVGFDDPKYFSRVFKEEFGVAPSAVGR